jgi:hypothetical protein
MELKTADWNEESSLVTRMYRTKSNRYFLTVHRYSGNPPKSDSHGNAPRQEKLLYKGRFADSSEAIFNAALIKLTIKRYEEIGYTGPFIETRRLTVWEAIQRYSKPTAKESQATA